MPSTSSRDPASTQKPVVTEWASGMRSVTTRAPFRKRLRRMVSGTAWAPPPLAAAPWATVATGAAASALSTAATTAVGRPEVAERLLGLGLEGLLERRVLALGRGFRSARGARLGGPGGLPGRGHGDGRAIGALLVAIAVADGRERDLALRVDVVDPDGELVTEVEDVFDPLDALAPAQLGYVHEAVAAGEDVDEGAELGDVHHLAGVHGAHLGLGRVEDQL